MGSKEPQKERSPYPQTIPQPLSQPFPPMKEDPRLHKLSGFCQILQPWKQLSTSELTPFHRLSKPGKRLGPHPHPHRITLPARQMEKHKTRHPSSHEASWEGHVTWVPADLFVSFVTFGKFFDSLTKDKKIRLQLELQTAKGHSSPVDPSNKCEPQLCQVNRAICSP